MIKESGEPQSRYTAEKVRTDGAAKIIDTTTGEPRNRYLIPTRRWGLLYRWKIALREQDSARQLVQPLGTNITSIETTIWRRQPAVDFAASILVPQKDVRTGEEEPVFKN